MTQEQLKNLIDQRITSKVGVSKSIKPNEHGALLKTVVDELYTAIAANQPTAASDTFDYPAHESLVSSHVDRLVMDNGNGQAVLTQKTAGTPAQSAIVQFAIPANATIAQPVNPIFELQILANPTDGDSFTLPHPISSAEFTLTARTSPSSASEFQIDSTIEDTRDAILSILNSASYSIYPETATLTASGTDTILIEFIKCPTEMGTDIHSSDFCLPEDFNNIDADFDTNTTGVFAYNQTQSAVNGIIGEAISGTIGDFEFNSNATIALNLSMNEETNTINLYLLWLLTPMARSGTLKWGLKIPTDAEELIDNLHWLFEGVGTGDFNLDEIFPTVTEIGTIEVEVGQPNYYFRATAIDTINITDLNSNSNPIDGNIYQEYQTGSYAQVTGIVLGFLKSVENGVAKISKSFINTAVLENGSDTLPNEEMGMFSPFKRYLVPSNEGKLANFILQEYADEEPQPYEVQITNAVNGVFIAIQEVASGNVLVRYQSAQIEG